MNKVTIAVTALNAIDSPGPGVPVIRGLKEASSFDARIIGIAYESLEPGIYMHDLIDKTDAEGLISSDHVACEYHFLGLGATDQPRQSLCSSESGSYAQADFGLAELRALRCKANVA